MHEACREQINFGADGAPWEFNLRDILRWLKLISKDDMPLPKKYVDFIYMQRLRTRSDVKAAKMVYADVYGHAFTHE